MRVVILAGGQGTRIREETEFRPKPLVPIGGKPVLWHIMKLYSFYNNNEFIICSGYKSELIKSYFQNFEFMNSDFTITLGDKSSTNFHQVLNESNWKVTVADTGLNTNTGARIHKIQQYVKNDTFFCTYGDGLSNVNLEALLKFHKSHGKIATMTTVNQKSRFGILEFGANNEVKNFREKPEGNDWINAGFFVFDSKIFNYLDENSVLEDGPLSKLALDGQLMAFKHYGFWQPMDTFREMTILNELWESGEAPWRIWS